MRERLVLDNNINMNKFTTYTSITYGVLLLIVGLGSFWTNGSFMALSAGVCGGIAILCTLSYGLRKHANNAYLFTAAISLILAMYFGITYALENSFLPNGLMLLLSSISYSLVGLSWLQNREEENAELDDNNEEQNNNEQSSIETKQEYITKLENVKKN